MSAFHALRVVLVKTVEQFPVKGDWLYEVKRDGSALAMKKRGTMTLFSRRGNNLNNCFPVISEAFDFLPDITIVRVR